MDDVFTSWISWGQAREQLVGVLPERTLEELDGAFHFALRWHGPQVRPTGDPYVFHLLEVVEILVRGAGITDPIVLVAAVLHDVLEDTPCPRSTLRDAFGDRVSEIVEWMTKPPEGGDESPEAARDRYLRSFRQAPAEARTVKLADRLSNVQTLQRHPRPEKQRSYYRETVDKILPFAEETPWFDDRFRAWREQYAYLAADA